MPFGFGITLRENDFELMLISISFGQLFLKTSRRSRRFLELPWLKSTPDFR